MRNEVRVIREIVNERGILSCPQCSDIQVRFDLIETQDVVEGVPGAELSYGNLRFMDELTDPVAALLMSHSRLTLTGDGIQTAVCFHKLNAFTVVSAIREIRPLPRIICSFSWRLAFARLLEGRRRRWAASAWTSRKASAQISGIPLTDRVSRA